VLLAEGAVERLRRVGGRVGRGRHGESARATRARREAAAGTGIGGGDRKRRRQRQRQNDGKRLDEPADARGKCHVGFSKFPLVRGTALYMGQGFRKVKPPLEPAAAALSRG